MTREVHEPKVKADGGAVWTQPMQSFDGGDVQRRRRDMYIPVMANKFPALVKMNWKRICNGKASTR